MRKVLSGLLLIPLGLALVVFAVANRHAVTLSFDPFNSAEPAFAIRPPLFVLLIGVAVLGVVAGGIATWFRQHHWRVRARRSEAELRQLRRSPAAQAPAAGFPPALPPS